MCADNLLSENCVIDGNGSTVEINASLFVRRKYNVGKITKERWVFRGICRETHKCFLFAVDGQKDDKLLSIIGEPIAPRSIVQSDKWVTFNGIHNLNKNYVHGKINHAKNFIDPLTGAHTQTVERMWGVVKRKKNHKYLTRKSLLVSYLSEFMWRPNMQKEAKNLFQTILEDIEASWTV